MLAAYQGACLVSIPTYVSTVGRMGGRWW